MTMISIGMVASFLTNNLTVGFIFGAVFNAPLVLDLVWAGPPR
jgi:ABC-2 type transport system permease protein